MKPFRLTPSSPVLIEITQATITLSADGRSLGVPIERDHTGRLRPDCRERFLDQLRGFLQPSGLARRRRAYCALDARGVSLRQASLPASGSENLNGLLQLQVESLFPLPPDRLAWGYQRIGSSIASPGGAGSERQFVLAALKRDVVEDYSALIVAGGLNPVFTLSATASGFVCPRLEGRYAILNLGRTQSECALFDGHAPVTIRVLSWGRDTIVGALQDDLGISREQAEALTVDSRNVALSEGQQDSPIRNAVRSVADDLATAVRACGVEGSLFVTGREVYLNQIAENLSQSLGLPAQAVPEATREAGSAAITGLKQALATVDEPAFLLLETRTSKETHRSLRHSSVPRWAAAAAALAFAVVGLRYAEPFFKAPALSRKMAEIRAGSQDLAAIDRELSFLQYLDSNQPPYLDALTVFSHAAPRGAQFESLSMNRRGDVSLRATMQNPPQAVEFRTKLIESGFFDQLVVEEQSPAPDNRKVAVRLTARWKPDGARQMPSLPEPKPEQNVPSLRTGPPGPASPGPPPAANMAAFPTGLQPSR